MRINIPSVQISCSCGRYPNIYTHCKPQEMTDTIWELNNELSTFLDWSKCLFLWPNLQKNQDLLFWIKSATKSLDDLPPIRIDGMIIPQVSDAGRRQTMVGVWGEGEGVLFIAMFTDASIFPEQPKYTYLKSSMFLSLGLPDIPRHKSLMCNISFHVSATKLWNALPRDVRVLPSLNTFKASLGKYLKNG